MNHYVDPIASDEPCLYIAMMKGDRCIVEEGPDECYLWNRLAARAEKIEGASDV